MIIADDMTMVSLLVMFLVALGGGFLDAIAGGGGLVTLPALLLVGLDPLAAIATNKCQAVAASVSASVAFTRRGLIAWRSLAPAAIVAAAASIAGAFSVRLLSPAILGAMVPLLLIAVALYFAFGPRIRTVSNHARLSPLIFACTAAPLLGFYDGIFGPGVGAFYMIALVLLSGCALLSAIAHTKALSVASNLGSLMAFALQGAIVWPMALTMIVGATLGAQCGAACAVRISPRAIRLLLVLMCCAMALRLLSEPANPLRNWLLHALPHSADAPEHPPRYRGIAPGIGKLVI